MNKKLLNAVAMAVVFIGITVIGYQAARHFGVFQNSQAQRAIVTVDVVRILNAERAVASKMAGDTDTSATTTLTHASKNLKQVIRRVAGPDAVVMVKQAIVTTGQHDIPDITDRVLDALGLPSDVATVTLPESLNQITNYGNSPAYRSSKAHFQHNKQLDRAWRKQSKRDSTESLLP